MSANLDIAKNGKASMAYTGQVPWHGEGQKVSPEAPLETWLNEAQLDWEVKETPLMYAADDQEIYDFDNRQVLYRSDNKQALSVVSANKYEIRQPRDIVEFFRDLVEHNGYHIETLGALDEGRKVWCLARFTGLEVNNKIGKEDQIDPYLLLSESYDKSQATRACFTGIRVVCQNTLHASESCFSSEVKTRHSQKFVAADVKNKLACMNEAFANYMRQMEMLTKVKLTDEDLVKFFAHVYSPEALTESEDWLKADLDEEKVTKQKQNVFATLLEAHNKGPGSQYSHAQNTGYGALQAVTFFQDHLAQTKQDKRWESTTFGQGARKKEKALESLMALAD